jgi:SET domain-containing protein
MHCIPGLYYANTDKKGRGVYCLNPIKTGDKIEVCPVIVIPEEDLKVIHNTALHDYYFLWGENQKSGAIALGFGSLYNHSSKPNAKFDFDYINETIDFECIRNIEVGEEITIDYHEGIRGISNLWFEIE